MKNTKAHRIALWLLKRYGCKRDAYSEADKFGFTVKSVSKDIRRALREKGSSDARKKIGDVPIESIAEELLAIGAAAEKPKRKKKWIACFEFEHGTEGVECTSFEEAKGLCLSCLEGWVADMTMELCDNVRSGKLTREEAVYAWNCMYYNCYTVVMRLNEESGEYEDYFFPSDRMCKRVGWVEIKEWIMPEDGQEGE